MACIRRIAGPIKRATARNARKAPKAVTEAHETIELTLSLAQQLWQRFKRFCLGPITGTLRLFRTLCRSRLRSLSLGKLHLGNFRSTILAAPDHKRLVRYELFAAGLHSALAGFRRLRLAFRLLLYRCAHGAEYCGLEAGSDHGLFASQHQPHSFPQGIARARRIRHSLPRASLLLNRATSSAARGSSLMATSVRGMSDGSPCNAVMSVESSMVSPMSFLGNG